MGKKDWIIVLWLTLLTLVLVPIIYIVCYFAFVEQAWITVTFRPGVTEQQALIVAQDLDRNMTMQYFQASEVTTTPWIKANFETDWLQGFLLRNSWSNNPHVEIALLQVSF